MEGFRPLAHCLKNWSSRQLPAPHVRRRPEDREGLTVGRRGATWGESVGLWRSQALMRQWG